MRLSSTAGFGGLVIVLTGLTLAATLDGPVAHAQAQTTDPNANVAKKAPPGSQRSSTWSQERMLTARPKPLPQVDPNTIKKGGISRAGLPATGNARDAGRGDARISGDVSGLPLKWAGKLFYRQPEGGYVCSGQFVTYNVVVTARTACVLGARSSSRTIGGSSTGSRRTSSRSRGIARWCGSRGTSRSTTPICGVVRARMPTRRIGSRTRSWYVAS